MSSESNKEYSVNWKNHMSHVRKAFDHLLSSNELTDVTLCCEGKKIGAHKMLLSACSTYFRDTFKDVPCQHPVIIMYGVEYGVLSDILHFIYKGEVSVDTSKLDTFLKTAQLLQISGLTDDGANERVTSENETTTESPLNDHNTEETYAEPITTAASSGNDEPRKGIKRMRIKELETTRDKMIRQENDTLFISDVKCEPSEIVNFEDPLEDPLLQTDQQTETKDFYTGSTGQNIGEEEFKLSHLLLNASDENCSSSLHKGHRLDGTLHILGSHPEGRRKDCVVCSNRKVPGCRKVTPFLCETCTCHPSLHVGECFKRFHTMENYKNGLFLI